MKIGTFAQLLVASVSRRVTHLATASRRRRAIRDIVSANDGRNLALLASHDLSLSGAPKIVLEMARALAEKGYRVVVFAMTDGVMRPQIEAMGAAVLIEPHPAGQVGALGELAARAEIAVANTIVCAPFVAAWAGRCPVVLYIHEVSLLAAKLGKPAGRRALQRASEVWCGSDLSADIARKVRPDVRVIPYGVAPVAGKRSPGGSERITVGVFGAIEPRKGQDLAIEGFLALTDEERKRIGLTLYGRTLDHAFCDRLREASRGLPQISFAGELDAAAYREAIAGVDAVLVSSRDDTLPLVSIDALSAGRLLLLTRAVGTERWLEDGVDSMMEPLPDAAAMTRLFRRALKAGAGVAAIGDAGRARFHTTFSREAFDATLETRFRALQASRA